jgi:hypothetical protein
VSDFFDGFGECADGPRDTPAYKSVVPVPQESQGDHSLSLARWDDDQSVYVDCRRGYSTPKGCIALLTLTPTEITKMKMMVVVVV